MVIVSKGTRGKFKSKLLKVIGILSLFYLLLSILSLSNCSKNTARDNLLADEDGFMGDISCRSCHEKEYDEWYGSHHDLAMQVVSDSTVLGDFNNSQFESNGVTTRFFVQDGEYFVNTEGPDGEYEDFQIKYTFGAIPLQQYLVEFPNGRYQCLHTAWDSEKNEWFDLMPDEKLATDDWLHWTKGSMNWNTMCADCHSTNLKKNFDFESDSYNTTWSAIDVSCESCHGPGIDHYSYIHSADYKAGKKIAGSYMKQVSGLTKSQQVDDCARCHSRRGQITDYYDYEGQFMDHYIPSLIVNGLYHVDGQILDEVYVYGSFHQSKMNHRNVSCMDCHNPHSLDLLFDGNDLCNQCHVKETYDSESHHFHPLNTESSQCVSCHMTGEVYMGNDFRRDHSFRVPRPDLSVRTGDPNACIKCHDDQSDEWAAEAVVKWYGPERVENYVDVMADIHDRIPQGAVDAIQMVGDTSVSEIIQASLIEFISTLGTEESNNLIVMSLDHYDPMVRYAAVGAMNRYSLQDRIQLVSPLLNDPVRSVRTMAAYQLAEASENIFLGEEKKRRDQAIMEFENSLDMQADFPSGQLLRGQYYHKQNKLKEAKTAYKEAVRQDPYLPQPYYYLANLSYGDGNMEEAKSYFNSAIENDSFYIDARYGLGLLEAEMGDLNGAEIQLAISARLSGNPRYYYNWGLTLQNLNRRPEAELAYLAGIEIDNLSEYNWYALTILYIQNGQNQKAMNAGVQLVNINPDNPEYRNLLRSISR